VQVVCGVSEDNYVQLPALWGTKQNVWAENFMPVNLTNFSVNLAALAPEGWDGRAMLLFAMKDGSPGTKIQVYVTEQA
jgi:hypothetical protein